MNIKKVSFLFTLVLMLTLLCLFRLQVSRLSENVIRVNCCLHLPPTWRQRQQFTTKGGNRAQQCAVTKTGRAFRLRRCEPACTSSEPVSTTSKVTRRLIMKTLIHRHTLRWSKWDAEGTDFHQTQNQGVHVCGHLLYWTFNSVGRKMKKRAKFV